MKKNVHIFLLRRRPTAEPNEVRRSFPVGASRIFENVWFINVILLVSLLHRDDDWGFAYDF